VSIEASLFAPPEGIHRFEGTVNEYRGDGIIVGDGESASDHRRPKLRLTHALKKRVVPDEHNTDAWGRRPRAAGSGGCGWNSR
jgi:hypothetical protein